MYPERDMLERTYRHREPELWIRILDSVMSVVTQKYGIQRSCDKENKVFLYTSGQQLDIHSYTHI